MSFIYAILATIMGLIFGIIGLSFNGQTMGLLMVFLMPFIYGIIGFIAGLIMGSLYNLVVKWVGGVEVEVEEYSE